jgi:hypothetical protein
MARESAPAPASTAIATSAESMDANALDNAPASGVIDQASTNDAAPSAVESALVEYDYAEDSDEWDADEYGSNSAEDRYRLRAGYTSIPQDVASST